MVSCSKSTDLSTAEIMMDRKNQMFSEALILLNEKDTARMRSPGQRARFFLLCCQAREELGLRDGSLLAGMEEATAWYALKRDRKRGVQAWFYLACQQRDAGDLPEAAVNFTRACDMARRYGNSYYEGASASNLSTVFCALQDTSEALEYAVRARDSFLRAKNIPNLRSARLHLARIYLVTGEFEQCMSVCDTILRSTEQLGLRGCYSEALRLSSVAAVHGEEPLTVYGREPSWSHSVGRARTQYYRQQEALLNHKAQTRNRWLFVCFAFGLVGAVLLVWRMGEQRKSARQKEQMASELAHKMSIYEQTIGETLDFGFGALNRLAETYYHPNTNHSQTYHDILQDYLSDIATRKRLKKTIEVNIDQLYDGILSRLQEQIPTLKEEEIQLFALCLFGCSYKTLVALDPKSHSLGSAYSRVSRLRANIEKSNAPDKTLFLSCLAAERHKMKCSGGN